MLKFFWDYSDTVFPFLLVLLIGSSKARMQRYPLLFVFLVLTALIMAYTNYLADKKVNNMYLYHIYSLVEVGLLIPLIISFSGRDKRLAKWVIGLFCCFWLADVILFEPFSKFNSNAASIAAFCILIFCFRYFLFLVKTDEVLYFQKLASFWIVGGLLFYYTTTILVIGSYKYKDWFTDTIDTHITWKIVQIANIVKFVLISIGIICCSPKTCRDGSS